MDTSEPVKAILTRAVDVLKSIQKPEDAPVIALYDVLLSRFDTYSDKQLFAHLHCIKDKHHTAMNTRHYGEDAYSDFLGPIQMLRCRLQMSLITPAMMRMMRG